MFDIDEMLMTFREMQLEQARLDALLIEQISAQQAKPGEEVTAILVSPMIDVGGTSVRARSTVLVAPGLLASMPRRISPEMTAVERLAAIRVLETDALPFVLPPQEDEA